MAALKKGLLSEIVVLKNIFIAYCVFPENSVYLFHESSWGRSLLEGYCIYFRRELELIIYNVFDRCLYLRYIVTSKEHLQPYLE